MDINTIPGKEQAHARGRMRRMWQRAVGVLACVVVFVTTYALILPAITMEKEAICCFEEHSHGEACFDSTQTDVMLCTFPEHIHSNACRETPETTAPAETKEPTSATEPTAETIPQEPTAPVITMEGEGMAPVLAPIPEDIIEEGYLANAAGEENAIHWKVVEEDDGTKILRVDGYGAIPDYGNPGNFPWNKYQSTTFACIVIGDGITRVGMNSFKSFIANQIIFGKDVESIAGHSFSYGWFTKVVFPGNVKVIESGAFIYGGISEFRFENGVETIQSLAFPNRNYSVHLPASVKNVAGSAFAGANKYTVDPDNPYMTAVDGVLYSKDLTVLLDYPSMRNADEYVTPETIVKIQDDALHGIANTRKFRITSNVKNLQTYRLFASGDRANHLEEIYIEDGVPLIVNWTFYNNPRLQKVRLPESPAITYFYGPAISCSSLESLKIPPNVVNINGFTYNSFECIPPHVLYDAKNADIKGDDLFKSASQSDVFDLEIGANVDNLPYNFVSFVKRATSIKFH